ncbi:MAG: tetratricopeptide repeat protein, partial [Methanomicrobiales archaeon]|nr:tetratricopeptide repeat protein [Methanomicrobiales archaeon]
AAYDQAIAQNPDYFNAWVGKGYALTRLGKYTEAIASYQEAARIQPGSTFAWRSLGYVYTQDGKSEEALAAFDTAIRIDANDTAAWVSRGLALSQMGRLNESIASYDHAIAIDPGDYFAWFSRGLDLATQGEDAEALLSFDRALAIDPRSSIAWDQKGRVLAGMGRYSEAIEAFDRGLIVDPQNTQLRKDRDDAQAALRGYIQGGDGGFPVLYAVPVIILLAAVVVFGVLRVKKRARAGTYDPSVEAGKTPLPPGIINHDVFISYSSRDKPIADAICATLEGQRIRCWIAPRDILPGTNYPNAIINAIETSRVMILVFSRHSNTSPHVIRELSKAVSRGVIVIPFRIEAVDPSKDMEYLIGIPHWLDAMNPPLERHLGELTRTVEILLSQGETGKNRETPAKGSG